MVRFLPIAEAAMTHEHLSAALRALRAVAHRAGVQIEKIRITVPTKEDAQRLYAVVADPEEPPRPALGGDVVSSQEAIMAWSHGENFEPAEGIRGAADKGLDGAVDDVQWEIEWREAGPLG